MLPVSDLHTLYWEISGNPDGIPVVFLHGGPGSGTSPFQRTFFNPEKYKIILFDQRGCGKSTPHACLEENTTPDLVADMEKLRKHLGLAHWLVFGGSWGATLALAYAHSHSDVLTGLVMYGIFLARPRELVDHFGAGVGSCVYPEIFEQYIGLLPEEDRANPIKGYYKLFTHADRAIRHKAIDMWTRWEKRISALEVSEESLNAEMANPDFVLSHSLIENHYFLHNGFIDGDKIIAEIGEKVKAKPVHIIQGRYDLVCPFRTAWEVHRSIPHSEMHISSKAGHTAKELETTDIIIEILDNLQLV